MTQDLYYYESGYIDNSYFVYTADAASNLNAVSSQQVDTSVIRNSIANVSSQFNFSASANVTRKTSAQLSAQFFAVPNTPRNPFYFVNALDINPTYTLSGTALINSNWDSVVDTNGNIYTLGVEAYGLSGTNYQYRLIIGKYDSIGRLQWQYKIEETSNMWVQGTNFNRFTARILLNNNFLYIGTIGQSINTLMFRFSLTNYTVDTYTQTTSGQITDMKIYGSNLYLICRNGNQLVVEQKPLGNLLARNWSRLITHTDGTVTNYVPSSPTTCAFDSTGNLYIPTTAVTGGSASIIFKVTSTGSVTGYKTTQIVNLSDLAIDTSNNIYMTSKSSHISKVNSSFVVQWARNISSPGPIVLDSNQTPISASLGLLLKYNPSTGDVTTGRSFTISNSTQTTNAEIRGKNVHLQDGYIQLVGSWDKDANDLSELFLLQVREDLNYDATQQDYGATNDFKLIRDSLRDTNNYYHKFTSSISYGSGTDPTVTWSSITPTATNTTPTNSSVTPVVAATTYTDTKFFIPNDLSVNQTFSAVSTVNVSPIKVFGTTLTLNAQSNVNVNFTVIKNAQSNLISNFTQTVNTTKLQQAIITCDSLFTPGMTVNAVRNTFAVLDSVSALSAQGYNTTERTVTLASEFTQVTVNDRIRYNSVALEVITQCEGFADIIDGGLLQEAHADITSEFTSLITVNVIKTDELDFYVIGNMTPDGVERIRTVDSTISTEFQQTVDNIRTRYESAELTTEFAQSISAGRILETSITCDALFAPSMTVNVIINTFAVLDSTSALATVAIANRSADIALASIINLSSQGDKFVSYAVDAQSEFQQTVDNTRTRNISAVTNADFATNIINSRTRDSSSAVSSQFTQNTIVVVVRNTTANLFNQTALTLDVNKTQQLESNLTASVSLDVEAGDIKRFSANLGSLFTPAMSVNAQRNMFAVLDAVSTVNAQAVKTTSTSSNINAQFNVTLLEQKIKDAVVESSIGGVNIQNANAVILIDNQISTSNSPRNSSKFSISFWAYNPLGVVLDTNPQGRINDVTYDWGGFFEFTNDNKLRFISYMNDQVTPLSYSNVTWTLPNTDNWHHYLIDYQVTPAGDQNPTTVKRNIYVDGMLLSSPTVSRSITVGTDGKGPGPDSIALYDGNFAGAGQNWPQLIWAIGAEIQNYQIQGYDRNYLISDASRNYTGKITQLAAWYDDNTPNFALSTERQKLFDGSYIPLGVDGTQSGLARPNIYLRLDSAGDIAQRGLNSLDTFWYYDSVLGGTEYLIPYTYQATDSSGRNSIITASLQARARVSNTGFTDCSSSFALACQVLKLQPGQLNLTAISQLQADNNFIHGYTANLTSQAQLSVTEVATRTVQANCQTTAQLTGTIDKFQGFAANLSVVSSLVNNTVNNRVRYFTSAISSSAQTSADTLRIKQLAATLQVQGFVQETTSKIGSLLVTVNVQSTMVIDASSGVNVQATLLAQSVQVTEPIKQVRTGLNIEARATTNISARRFRNNVEEFDTTFTQTTTTNNSKIVGFSAALSSNFAQVINNKRIRNPGAQTLQSQFAETLLADNFKGFALALSTQVQQVTQAVKTVRPATNFQSIAIEMVTGRAITYDRNLTLYVKKEYRTLIILEESTLLKVPAETRVNMVRT